MIGLLLVSILALLGLSTLSVIRGWVELVLIGCNDDWASKASNLAELLTHNPDVIFIQEGKAAHYRDLRSPDGKRLLPRHVWGVHQDVSSPARAGSVVIFRYSAIRRGGSGFTYGTKARGILTRWIAWVRGSLAITGAWVRLFLFSAHYPPVRVRRWWRPFGLHLWARLRLAMAAGRLVIGQMDSNRHGGPTGIPRGLVWVAVPGSIDGFVLSKQIHVLGPVEELPKGSSDHHPIKIRVRVPVRPRG